MDVIDMMNSIYTQKTFMESYGKYREEEGEKRGEKIGEERGKKDGEKIGEERSRKDGKKEGEAIGTIKTAIDIFKQSGKSIDYVIDYLSQKCNLTHKEIIDNVNKFLN